MIENLLAGEIVGLVAHRLRHHDSAEGVFDALVIAVSTFIAGAIGSPVDHREMCDQFHQRILIEMPRARHRLNQLARQDRG